MPRATINNEEVERFDLKTCPEGFVELRKMSYGQILHRREMAAKMSFGGDGSKRGGRLSSGEMQMMQRKVAQYEFSRCVVTHNLEDDEGKPLNFTRPDILDVLDPRIGEEIGQLIESMNTLDEDELGN